MNFQIYEDDLDYFSLNVLRIQRFVAGVLQSFWGLNP